MAVQARDQGRAADRGGRHDPAAETVPAGRIVGRGRVGCGDGVARGLVRVGPDLVVVELAEIALQNSRQIRVPVASQGYQTAVAELAIPGILWCSASQKRL